MPSPATRLAYARHQATLVRRTDAIDGSFTTGSTAPLVATAGTSDASVSVVGHNRVYGAETGYRTVALSSGTVTHKTFGSVQYVYYDDTTLKSTLVTFLSSTDAKVAQANYAPGRHALGPVTMPSSAGAPATGGGGGVPPGGGASGPIP